MSYSRGPSRNPWVEQDPGPRRAAAAHAVVGFGLYLGVSDSNVFDNRGEFTAYLGFRGSLFVDMAKGQSLFDDPNC